MTRMRGALGAGVIAVALWLASAIGFAVLVWRGFGGDLVRLVVPETIPVEVWHSAAPLDLVRAAGSAVLIGAVTTLLAAIVLERASGGSRLVVGAALWFSVVVAAFATAVLSGIGASLGDGGPGRLADLGRGIPELLSSALGWALLVGWIPATVGVLVTRGTPTPGHRAFRRTRGGAELLAVLAAVILVAGTAVQVAQARADGLAGIAPPTVVQPVPTVTPTPPSAVAPGSDPAVAQPGWCATDQLAFRVTGEDAATGHRAATIVAENTGEVPCVLPDYPDIAFAGENGGEILLTVQRGGSFMTIDPGSSSPELAPGAEATSFLGWDATDGRSAAEELFVAPWTGARRAVVDLDPTLDLTAASVVGASAWALAD